MYLVQGTSRLYIVEAFQHTPAQPHTQALGRENREPGVNCVYMNPDYREARILTKYMYCP